MSASNWIHFRSVQGRTIAGGCEFVLGEVTSQAKVYKQNLRDLLRLEMKLEPQEGEFEVSIVIELNPNFPAIDLDNVAKAVLDGIKGHVFYDDAQVMRLEVEKRWADAESVTVTVLQRPL